MFLTADIDFTDQEDYNMTDGYGSVPSSQLTSSQWIAREYADQRPEGDVVWWQGSQTGNEALDRLIREAANEPPRGPPRRQSITDETRTEASTKTFPSPTSTEASCSSSSIRNRNRTRPSRRPSSRMASVIRDPDSSDRPDMNSTLEFIGDNWHERVKNISNKVDEKSRMAIKREEKLKRRAERERMKRAGEASTAVSKRRDNDGRLERRELARFEPAHANGKTNGKEKPKFGFNDAHHLYHPTPDKGREAAEETMTRASDQNPRESMEFVFCQDLGPNARSNTDLSLCIDTNELDFDPPLPTQYLLSQDHHHSCTSPTSTPAPRTSTPPPKLGRYPALSERPITNTIEPTSASAIARPQSRTQQSNESLYSSLHPVDVQPSNSHLTSSSCDPLRQRASPSLPTQPPYLPSSRTQQPRSTAPPPLGMRRTHSSASVYSTGKFSAASGSGKPGLKMTVPKFKPPLLNRCAATTSAGTGLSGINEIKEVARAEELTAEEDEDLAGRKSELPTPDSTPESRSTRIVNPQSEYQHRLGRDQDASWCNRGINAGADEDEDEPVLEADSSYGEIEFDPEVLEETMRMYD